MLRLRRPWLAAVIPMIVVAIATSCSDDPAPPSGLPDSGAQPGQLGESVCPDPDAAPEAGASCVLPEGTTCSFGACAAATIARCTRGTWRFAGNPAPSQDAEALCPADFPASETKCPDCVPPDLSCRYGTCDGADATANVSSASCSNGLWTVTIVETCPPRDGGPEASTDAGTDVQGDAEPDVD